MNENEYQQMLSDQFTEQAMLEQMYVESVKYAQGEWLDVARGEDPERFVSEVDYQPEG